MASTENNYPKISIITPSFNQGEFLEDTIRSILDQGYPNLEYIIFDGNSTDNSLEIIQKYAKYLSCWVSEPDHGMYHALNKGFAKSSGQIMAWLNSSDLYCPWALDTVADVFSQLDRVEWVTSGFPMVWDEKSRAVKCRKVDGFSRESFLDGRHVNLFPNHLWPVQQESTFWRRSLWDRTGGYVSEDHCAAGDFELWSRFFQHTDLFTLETTLGGFRRHLGQKSSDKSQYRAGAARALESAGPGDYAREALDILGSASGQKRKLHRQVMKLRRKLGYLFGRRPLDRYTFPYIRASGDDGKVTWKVRSRNVVYRRGEKHSVNI